MGAVVSGEDVRGGVGVIHNVGWAERGLVDEIEIVLEGWDVEGIGKRLLVVGTKGERRLVGVHRTVEFSVLEEEEERGEL